MAHRAYGWRGTFEPGPRPRRIRGKIFTARRRSIRIDLLKNSKSPVLRLPPGASARQALVRVTWGDNIYQRRANTGLTSGIAHRRRRPDAQARGGPGQFLRARRTAGRLESPWTTAAVSNDRDGFLADISGVGAGPLRFKLQDPALFGSIERPEDLPRRA